MQRSLFLVCFLTLLACFCKEGAAGVLCDERPLCGDAVVQAAEQCDDGNRDDGDGCDGLCSVE